MTSTSDSQIVDWLLENGGPVIRYRTAVELANESTNIDLDRLERDLLAAPMVRVWLDNLKPGRIHNSKDTDFENAMGRLLEFGLRAGMPPLDKRTRHFRRWLSTALNAPRGMMRVLNGSIVSAGLARAGYVNDEPVQAFLLDRLDVLSRTTRKTGYDIYADPGAYTDVPEPWRTKNTPVVKPEFCPEGEFGLPYIHDLYGLSALPPDLATASANRKVDAVVRYILAPEYQVLPPGYGLLRAGKGKYYAIGWKVDLPGYRGLDMDAREAKALVARVELMAHFLVARKHAWFQNAVRHLETFRTDECTYVFPRRYLQESRNNYWVSGGHMGLEQNRRPSRALEVESTFRMLRIRKLARG